MKDKSITDVVRWLEENLHCGLLVVDHWEGDMSALAVGRPEEPNRLVYLSTCNRPPGRHFVELEIAPPEGSDLPYSIGARYEDIDRDALLGIARQHLNF
jgi:hypothetical protein